MGTDFQARLALQINYVHPITANAGDSESHLLMLTSSAAHNHYNKQHQIRITPQLYRIVRTYRTFYISRLYLKATTYCVCMYIHTCTYVHVAKCIDGLKYVLLKYFQIILYYSSLPSKL